MLNVKIVSSYRITCQREAILGLFSGKIKASGKIVSVCQESAGVGVASVKRDPTGRASLLFAEYLPCASAEECQRIIQQQVQQQNLQKSHCVTVLPQDSYQLIQVETANLPDAERREAVRWQIGGRIDYPAEEAVIDLYEVAPFNSEKKPLIYVVSAQQKLLRERVQMLKRSDLSVAVIDASEFALRNICDLYTEDERGTALLLLLEQRGVLVIVRDGILYLVRWLSSGMDDLIPFADGDYEALTEQLDAIVLEVQRSFDYCESTFHLPMVSRLLVAQTQREIPAVVTYLNDYLTTTVENLSFADVLSIPEESEQLQLNRCLLAIGGALRQENS